MKYARRSRFTIILLGAYEGYFEYLEFIYQSLELFQFVPCDKIGIPITNEIMDINKLEFDGPADKQDELRKEYKAALKKVLFKGFVLELPKNRTSHGRLLSLNGRNVAGYNDITMALEFINNPTTIEGLIGTGIELIPTQACEDIINNN